MNLSIHTDPVGAASACGVHLLGVLDEAAKRKERVTLAISGGSSPKWMFQEMARRAFPWKKLHLFWVDERVVPPTDEQSNFRLAQEHWLTPAAFPAANVHRVHGELSPDEAAARYRQEITEFFSLRTDEVPVFDAIHLGMGDDAHTASLFPGDSLTNDRTGIADSVFAPKKPHSRVTLLPAVLLAAANVAMLVTGADKANPLKLAVDADFDPSTLPIQLIVKECPRAIWFVDEAAAALLSR